MQQTQKTPRIATGRERTLIHAHMIARAYFSPPASTPLGVLAGRTCWYASELRAKSESVDARIAGRAHYQAGIACLNREILHVIFVEEISDKERDLPGPSLPKAQAGIDHAVAINHRESRVGRLTKRFSTGLQFALQIGSSRNAGNAHRMRVFTPQRFDPTGKG